MGHPKRTVSDTITVELQDGRRVIGRRTIEGTRKLFQTIYYGTEKTFDGHPYAPTETVYMDSVARIILRELIGKQSG